MTGPITPRKESFQRSDSQGIICVMGQQPTIQCKLCGKEFASVRATHLWRKHGWRDRRPVERYKRQFRLRTASSLGTRRKCKDIQVRRWQRLGLSWTKGRVLQVLKERRRAGQPLAYTKVSVGLQGAAGRYFGSWPAALRAAGVDPRSVRLVRPPWTKAQVVDEIRGAYRSGELCFGSRFHLRRNDLFQAAAEVFGSWSAAVKAAKVPRPKRPPSVTGLEQVKAFIQERIREGKSIRSGDVVRASQAMHKWGRLLSGKSWPELVKSMGFAYPEKGIHRRWTKDSIIEEIKCVHRDRDAADGGQVSAALRCSARRLFGSWAKAVQAGGLRSWEMDGRKSARARK
jgi:hypothetical protein